MSTLTVNIPDDVEKRLCAEALRREFSIEDLIREILMTALPGRRQSFQEAMESTFRDNDEVYRRLAQ